MWGFVFDFWFLEPGKSNLHNNASESFNLQLLRKILATKRKKGGGGGGEGVWELSHYL